MIGPSHPKNLSAAAGKLRARQELRAPANRASGRIAQTCYLPSESSFLLEFQGKDQLQMHKAQGSTFLTGLRTARRGQLWAWRGTTNRAKAGGRRPTLAMEEELNRLELITGRSWLLGSASHRHQRRPEREQPHRSAPQDVELVAIGWWAHDRPGVAVPCPDWLSSGRPRRPAS